MHGMQLHNLLQFSPASPCKIGVSYPTGSMLLFSLFKTWKNDNSSTGEWAWKQSVWSGSCPECEQVYVISHVHCLYCNSSCVQCYLVHTTEKNSTYTEYKAFIFLPLLGNKVVDLRDHLLGWHFPNSGLHNTAGGLQRAGWSQGAGSPNSKLPNCIRKLKIH